MPSHSPMFMSQALRRYSVTVIFATLLYAKNYFYIYIYINIKSILWGWDRGEILL